MYNEIDKQLAAWIGVGTAGCVALLFWIVLSPPTRRGSTTVGTSAPVQGAESARRSFESRLEAERRTVKERGDRVAAEIMLDRYQHPEIYGDSKAERDLHALLLIAAEDLKAKGR